MDASARSNGDASGRHERLLAELRRLADGTARLLGVEVVDLTLRGPVRRRVLRVDIDRPGPDGVGLEDCGRLSDALGRAIEEGDVIPGSYVLEVSSPGVDRPIESDDDVRRNRGRRVDVVEVVDDGARERRVSGVLQGRDEVELTVVDDDGRTIRIPRSRVRGVRQHVGF